MEAAAGLAVPITPMRAWMIPAKRVKFCTIVDPPLPDGGRPVRGRLEGGRRAPSVMGRSLSTAGERGQGLSAADEDDGGMRSDGVGLLRGQRNLGARLHGVTGRLARGIDEPPPALAGSESRQLERVTLPVGVGGHVDVVVAVAGEEVHGQAAGRLAEVDLAELPAVPGHPRPPRVVLEERPPPERGMGLAEAQEAGHEAEEVPLPLSEAPVHPPRLVVVAVRVVVAALRAEELVAPQDHGHALRHEEERQEVAGLALAEGDDLRFLRLALLAAVPGEVLAVAVAIALAVLQVVLLVVAHEVAQGEPVVAGHEVHAVPGSPPGAAVEVGAPREARREVGHHARVALHEAAQLVAELPVPLRPPSPAREAS